jgi:Tfp pilus assembly protein PilX
MAENFTNAKAVLADSATTIYTCPAATKAIVIGCQVANISATSKNLSIWWTDSSDTNAITRLGELIALPTQSVYEPVSGKLVLEAGDTIVGTSSVASDLEATVSILEIS